MKRWISITAAVATVALFAWTVAWTMAARHVGARFTQWTKAQEDAGVAVAFGSFDVKGWPFGWRAVVETPSIKGAGAAGWTWSGERVVAYVDPRDLSRVTIRLPGEHLVRFGAGDLATKLVLRAARPEGAIGFDATGRVARLDLDLEALEMRLDAMAEPLQIRALVGTLSPQRPAAPDHTTDTLDVKFRADGVRLPAPVAPLAALGRDIASAELDAHVKGRIAGTKLAEALAIWRDDGGTLDVAKAAIAWGPLYLAGDATLALDEKNRPMGAATARIAGFVETIDALAGAGAIPPTTGAVMKIALSVLARQDPQLANRPTVRVPMAAQDGVFSVQNFRLFTIPPLDLD